jgi:hypothetical protein
MSPLSEEILQTRKKYQNRKVFWDRLREESRQAPQKYKKALQEIIEHSETLKLEILSELLISKFDGHYSQKEFKIEK